MRTEFTLNLNEDGTVFLKSDDLHVRCMSIGRNDISSVPEKFGVYMLINDSRGEIYVGETENKSLKLKGRIQQHDAKWTWWNRVVVFYREDDAVFKDYANRHYIENQLFELIKSSGDCLSLITQKASGHVGSLREGAGAAAGGD